MNKLVHFANELDKAGLFKHADAIDRLLVAFEQVSPESQLKEADRQAIEHMKESIKTQSLPDALVEQMEIWIRNKEKELH